MKGWFLLVMCIAACRPNVADQAGSEALTLEVSAEKPVFCIREDINLVGGLRCKSPSPTWVNRRFSFPETDLTISFRDESGRLLTLLPGKPPRRLERSDFTLMKDGDLLDIPLKHIQTLPTNGLPPGTYDITVTFHNLPALEIGMRTGNQRLISNNLKILIQ